jgi:ParB-like chromosome segregation protein Spo0J
MLEIATHPEIERRLFPLRDEEYRALRASMEREGVREPLIVWPQDGRLVLVDGHNRWRIARELGLECPVAEREFGSLEEVLDWVDRNQIARRNLTDAQFAVVIGRIYEREKKAVGRPEKSAQNEHISERTAEKIAAEFGVGQATVRRAAEFAKAVDAIREKAPAAAEKILRDEVPDALTELPKLARKPDLLEAAAEKLARGEAKKVKEAVVKARSEARERRMAEREAEARKTDAPEWRLLLGDLLEAGKELPDASVHAIVTDPPYGREHLGLYRRLGELAARVLVPGGICLVMTGQSHLCEAMARLAERLNYVWTLAYLTPGHSTQIFCRRIRSNWKPVLYFSKGPPAWEHVGDVVVSKERDKRFHEWGQSESGMTALIERFTVPGQTVLDPFCGAGTTGVAAVALGRRFVGIDLDAGALEKARARLEAASRARQAGEGPEGSAA